MLWQLVPLGHCEPTDGVTPVSRRVCAAGGKARTRTRPRSRACRACNDFGMATPGEWAVAFLSISAGSARAVALRILGWAIPLQCSKDGTTLSPPLCPLCPFAPFTHGQGFVLRIVSFRSAGPVKGAASSRAFVLPAQVEAKRAKDAGSSAVVRPTYPMRCASLYMYVCVYMCV